MATVQERLDALKKEQEEIEKFLKENKEEFESDMKMAYTETIGNPTGFKQTMRGTSTDFKLDKGRKMTYSQFKKFVRKRAAKKDLDKLDATADEQSRIVVERGQCLEEDIEEGPLLVTEYMKALVRQDKIKREARELEAHKKRQRPTPQKKKRVGFQKDEKERLRAELEEELDRIEGELSAHEERAKLVKEAFKRHGEAIGLEPGKGLMTAKAVLEWDTAAKEKMQAWKALNEVALMEKVMLKGERSFLKKVEREYNRIVQHPTIKTRHKNVAGTAMDVDRGVFPSDSKLRGVIDIAKTLPPGGIQEEGELLSSTHIRSHGEAIFGVIRSYMDRRERIQRLEGAGSQKLNSVRLDFEDPARLRDQITAPLRARRREIKKRLKKL